MNRHFNKDNVLMANNHMHSTSLIIREMQIKTTRYHLTPVTKAIIKKQEINAGEDVEKREPSAGWNVNWCSHCGKQAGGSSKS